MENPAYSLAGTTCSNTFVNAILRKGPTNVQFVDLGIVDSIGHGLSIAIWGPFTDSMLGRGKVKRHGTECKWEAFQGWRSIRRQ